MVAGNAPIRARVVGVASRDGPPFLRATRDQIQSFETSLCRIGSEGPAIHPGWRHLPGQSVPATRSGTTTDGLGLLSPTLGRFTRAFRGVSRLRSSPDRLFFPGAFSAPERIAYSDPADQRDASSL